MALHRARFDRLHAGLSARERAVLVLRSLKAKRPEEPGWRATMPPQQVREFNRLITLINACNVYLPLYITAVEQRSEQLWLRFAWLQTMVGMGLSAWRLAELLPAARRPRAAAAVARSFPRVELPWDREEHEHSWISLAEAMEADIRLDLAALWQELRGIDTGAAEVARELDGEDPLRPVMRAAVETARAELTDLHALLDAVRPLALEEPDAEALDLARTYFEKGRQLMESL